MVIPVFGTEEPPDLGNGRMRSKETYPRSRIRPDRVNVAKWVDEPEQNYTDGTVGDWSKLLTLEPAVVAEHQNRTRAC
jgi:hypothetical protein